MNKFLLAFSAAAVVATGVSSAATVFTSRADFDAAVPTTVLDTFDNDIANADSITFDSGVTSSKSRASLTLNRVVRGEYDGFVTRDDFQNITFTFGSAVTAFGADFSGISNSLFVTGNFDGSGDQTFALQDIIGSDGFFGVMGSASLTSIVFTTNAGVVIIPGNAPFGGQTFSLDNLAFAPVDAVPLPAALPLFGAALAGGAVLRRRKKA